MLGIALSFIWHENIFQTNAVVQKQIQPSELRDQRPLIMRDT